MRYSCELPMTAGLDDLFATLPAVLNAGQVAELIGLSRAGTYKWLTEGKLPGFKKNGIWFVVTADLKAWFIEGSNQQHLEDEPCNTTAPDDAPPLAT